MNSPDDSLAVVFHNPGMPGGTSSARLSALCDNGGAMDAQLEISAHVRVTICIGTGGGAVAGLRG